MTVSSQTSTATFVGNGVATAFPLPFRFFNNSDIRAYFIDSTTGAATPMALGTDYSLIGAGEPEVDGSALSLLTTVVPLASMRGLYVERVMQQVQETDIVNQGQFFASTHEDVFDRLTMLIQQNSQSISRALKVPLSDPEPNDLPNVISRADKLLSFDTAGNPVAVAPVGGSATDLAILLASTATGNGDEMIGVKQPYVGSVARTQHSKNVDTRTAADFGAVGDGTDETAKLKAARDAIGLVELEDGKTYRISSQLAATGHQQGFWCKGKAQLSVMVGNGEFDKSNYSGNLYASNGCAVLCEGFDRYTLKNVIIQMESTAAVRTVKAFGLRDSYGSHVEIEALNFKECDGGVVGLDSLKYCYVDAYVHDCGTSNATLPTMQVTGVSIDDDRISLIDTTNTFVRAHGENIVLSGAALALYGPQTDGVNIAGTGDNHGLVVEAKWDNVGEAFDCFGSFVHAKVSAKNCHLYGVKLIHGAQHCVIHATVDTTVGAALVFGSSSTATQDVAYNHVTVTASNVGVLSGRAVAKAGFQTDGPSAPFNPRDNYVRLILEGAPQTVYAAIIEAGKRNLVEYSGVGSSMILEANITTTAGAGNIIRRVDNKNGGYKVGRFYGGEFINLASNSPLVIAANVLYAIPFKVNDLLIATKIGTWISVVGAGVIRFGIYKWLDGVPGDLVLDCGTIPNNVTGAQDLSINGGNGVSLPEGMYALAMVTNSAFTAFSSTSNASTLGMLGTTVPGSASDNQITAPFAFAALPLTFPAANFTANNLPNIWLRR